MKKLLLIFSFCLALLSCDRRETANFVGGATLEDNAEPPAVSLRRPKQPAAGDAVAAERKLIRNGALSFETSDVKKTKTTIDAICKELNAYISNESQNNYSSRLQYNQTIRVTADKFDLLIQKVEAEASRVEGKNVNTEDVTEEFIDVEARLKTKKDLETRYREILKQAKTVEEIITIERQIAEVRSDIESMEGRLKYLSSQVAYSTLTVSFYETIGTDFGFGSKIGGAFGTGWQYFLSFLIGLVNVWPFLILMALVIWLAFRWDKRRHKKTTN
ncbi:MAG: DUF4349 domain-containing protein [Cyclobacteriaceae bacterium]|nr:DUF4349 domain-containing protein [Cyclobacteriaceae bacterium]